MPDPLDHILKRLRDPSPVAEPEPGFAAALRSRLDAALRPGPAAGGTGTAPPLAHQLAESARLPERSTTMATTEPPGTTTALPAHPTLVPYLAVDGARAAIDWYVAVFGARAASEPVVMPGGLIGHVALDLRGAALYLSDESPASHVRGPVPGADASVSLVLEVHSVDEQVALALAEGASLERPAADHPYGRDAVVRDPFGHRWMISGPVVAGAAATRPAPESGAESGAEPIRHGDVGYASLWVKDEARARRFFSAVLGWPLERHRDVPWRAVNHGFAADPGQSTLFCAYTVDDLDAASERVRASGGTAGEPAVEPWGSTADCVDPEGLRFALYEPPAGRRTPRPAPNGEHHGDLSYITMHVRDSAVERAFYSAVLGWQFEPGRVEDGWEPVGVAPMTGLSGGHPATVIVPMYRVDDVRSAVGRVRAAGGQAPEPEQQPYGLTAECRDDQGTRFYLGELEAP